MLHIKARKPVGVALSFICLALATALFALPGCTSCRADGPAPPPREERRGPDRCFTKAPSLEKQREIARRLQKRRETTPMVRSPGSVIIPVYFHVLTNSEGSDGDVRIDALMSQICVLNAAFSGKDPKASGGSTSDTPFRFVFAGMDKTANNEWFNMPPGLDPSPQEIAAKAALKQGDSSTLNIYTAKVDGAYGWTRWPWDLDAKVDGVVVSYTALPGGTCHKCNLGDVVTHEVGHWLGLFHTFEGEDCDGDGDFVADTWAELSPAFTCASRDSCRAYYNDPVNNFMDYPDDECIYEFTAGQADRMDTVHLEYRTP